jgi:Protein of unknown function (DUF2934)
MSATATARSVERESEMRKPPGRESASHSHVPETSMQDIAKLAYALWQQRGCPYGSPEFDWLEAERKLRESSEQVSR